MGVSLCPRITNIMKTLVIAAAVLVARAVSMPGGYTGYGGVYKAMNVAPETMNAARQVSKMAIFEDESRQGDAETRRERNTALYVPTFFTGVPQTELHPVAAAHVYSQRFRRDANNVYGTYPFVVMSPQGLSKRSA